MRSVSPLVITSLLALTAACAPEGSSAYVTRNVPLDNSCAPEEDSDIGIATGVYDIGNGDTPASCLHSYLMTLVVNSNLKANAQDATGRAEPNVLLITHADVTVMRKDERPIQFLNDSGEADSTRPNPYRVRTAASLAPTTSTVAQTGIVQIEAIPKAYASALSQFSGDNILLEIQVFGTTTGDVDVDFRPFQYPLAICRHCLSFCRDEFAEDSEISDIRGDTCPDNVHGGQDGMICVDDC